MRSHAVIVIALAACKGAERPRRPPSASAQTIGVSRDGFRIRGAAGDGTSLYASFASKTESLVEARRGAQVVWTAPLAGTAGELAVAGAQLAVALEVRGTLRGDPAAQVSAVDRASGAARWQLAFESTEWALVHAVAGLGDDFVVGGAFGGTLRVADKVVTSGGGSDGFVARITRDGKLAWLVRMGGAFSDAIEGVATDGKARIAIAGTFSLTGEILGEPLKSTDEKVPFGDAFVAELDSGGARMWSASFGGKADDTVAGVAIDDTGRVAVAANVREVLTIAGYALVPRGPGDGLVVWFGAGGELGTAVLVGGNDFDGLRAITAVGDHVIVGGFFSGSIPLGGETLKAGGGDDSFLAALDANGTVVTAWQIGGSGREEITSLTAVAGGAVAGVAYTGEAELDGVNLPAPKDGSSIGSALVVRGR